MDGKEKLRMLRKLSEADLTKKFLIPLFESEGMGCRNVCYTHRRLELGRGVVHRKEFDSSPWSSFFCDQDSDRIGLPLVLLESEQYGR